MEWLVIAAIIGFIAWRMMGSKNVKSINTLDLKNSLNDKSKQFIDVRTPAEYKGHHISQFTNMPLNTLQNQLTKLDKDKETVVICQSGMRSSRACQVLKQAGFTNVTNVRGGMSQWNG
ncbi:rhodanese-like domain-containing protein [Chryseomicrobium sp. FSL W7-1435]|uniref:rhodanese-like domain-containing protein n=1 Tax=Chryseomicrobium sp. FSL W7-1435 TaxID=2921704 RepID=UPI00315A3A13